MAREGLGLELWTCTCGTRARDGALGLATVVVGVARAGPVAGVVAEGARGGLLGWIRVPATASGTGMRPGLASAVPAVPTVAGVVG